MVLKSILKIFGECLHEVVLSFQKKMLIDCPRLNDSMEISSAVDKYVAPVKRPMPNELWLWRQWHVPVEFNFTHYTNLF